MAQRRTGVLLLAAAGLALVLGMVMLTVGFVVSSAGPVYLSIALTVVAAPLAVAGLVVLLCASAR